jgi:DNA-binding NarL/FixJ family response regulator
MLHGVVHVCPRNDITSRKHGGVQTSNEAHATTPESYRENLRQRLFEVIAASMDGKTADELVVELDIPLQTVSARLSELLRDRRIEDSGRRRATRRGKSARVLVGRAG